MHPVIVLPSAHEDSSVRKTDKGEIDGSANSIPNLKSANSVTHTVVALSAVVMDTHPLKAHRCLPRIHPCMLPAGT